MTRIRTLGVGVAMLAGAFFIGTAFRSPISQAHGAYSTPVTVLNTTSNPAIASSMDNPGRIAYFGTLASNCSGVNLCFWAFPTIPAGHRVVITGMSGNLQWGGNAGQPYITLSTAVSGGGPTTQFMPAYNFALGSLFYQPVQLAYDGGQQLVVAAGSSALTNFSGFSRMELYGYELDCSAAPCPAIAH